MSLVDRLRGHLRRGVIGLELGEIQATVLRYRPEPYYGTHIIGHISDARGGREVLRRLSDPFWFQAFGCVLGFDWHSSGVTTTVCGAVKEAIKDIDADPRQLLMVAQAGDEVVGTLQLTVIPGLSRLGATRALIEAVRVRSDQRGSGLGGQLIAWAIDTARERGAAMIQLTTDASRKDAHRFYERLGFVASHVGMKLVL